MRRIIAAHAKFHNPSKIIGCVPGLIWLASWPECDARAHDIAYVHSKGRPCVALVADTTTCNARATYLMDVPSCVRPCIALHHPYASAMRRKAMANTDPKDALC